MFAVILTPEQLGTVEALLFLAAGNQPLAAELQAEALAIREVVKANSINVHDTRREGIRNLRYAG